MTETVAKYSSESDESENKAPFQSPEKMKETVDNSHLGVSGESDEYGTASDDEESGDYSDEDETNSEDGPDDLDENEESVVANAERQSGDGQEQDSDQKKKVDDDEDRSNPQYIPKKGTFYEHDDRTAEDADADVEEVEEESTDDPSNPGASKEKEGKKRRPNNKEMASISGPLDPRSFRRGRAGAQVTFRAGKRVRLRHSERGWAT